MKELKFKKLDYKTTDAEGNEVTVKSEGKLPTRATSASAGVDLYCTRITQEIDNSGKLILVYHTDLSVHLPEGYVGILAMKSGIAKRSLTLVNGFGTIDQDYLGELVGKFKVTTDAIPTVYQPGEAFAQLLVVPCAILEPTWTEEEIETERGTMGFGEADEKLNDNEKVHEEIQD